MSWWGSILARREWLRNWRRLRDCIGEMHLWIPTLHLTSLKCSESGTCFENIMTPWYTSECYRPGLEITRVINKNFARSKTVPLFQAWRTAVNLSHCLWLFQAKNLETPRFAVAQAAWIATAPPCRSESWLTSQAWCPAARPGPCWACLRPGHTRSLLARTSFHSRICSRSLHHELPLLYYLNSSCRPLRGGES